MVYVRDKHELKPGIVIFRRGDVMHANWHCRIKLPGMDRYKTISLGTSDIEAARAKTIEHETKFLLRLKSDVPVFTRPFSEVAREYLIVQERGMRAGHISQRRIARIRSIIVTRLNAYVGASAAHQIDHACWANYPAWRQAFAPGRNGSRVSNATIYAEMAIFEEVMALAVSRKYAMPGQNFGAKPKPRPRQRDALTLDEYRHLVATGQSWAASAPRPSSAWLRTVAYNFMLIICNTGLRPSEAKGLLWRDIAHAADHSGRDLIVISVRGRDKSRNVVAPLSVGKYLNRIRVLSCATESNDPVFVSPTGEPAATLYQPQIADLLKRARLRIGPSNIARSTYCFRHTYAAFRLGSGVDPYFLAIQMGTSVRTIEDVYGYLVRAKYAGGLLPPMNDSDWDAGSINS